MIQLRRVSQYSFGDGLIAEQTSELWEPWMRQADKVLEDEQLINAVYEGLLKRHAKSRTRGRPGVPAEIVLRMLLLKHIRNWSFAVVEREVRANLVYREFTRVGAAKVPDAKTLGRQARALGPDVVKQIHERMVALALENKVIQGRRMRVDTTVVETNIHYPTDSSLLGDGTRVLTRLMKKVRSIAGETGTKLRDRMRSMQRNVMRIGRAARIKGERGKKAVAAIYRKTLATTGRVIAQAKRFAGEIANGVKGSGDVLKQAVLDGLKREIDIMVERTGQVVRQAKARVFGGDTHVNGKIVSVFEPSTEVIRKGKASKPTEFGKMVKVQEAENQIVIDYEVYDKKPSDTDLLVPAIERHEELTGRTPELVAADNGFFSAKNEAAAHEKGVKQVSIPNRSTKSEARRQNQKKRWFRNGQKWRTGCEGRISLLKRRHGLRRSLYKDEAGMKRWVGFGVIADNLINIAKAMAK
jgi:transposase, IS5 family